MSTKTMTIIQEQIVTKLRTEASIDPQRRFSGKRYLNQKILIILCVFHYDSSICKTSGYCKNVFPQIEIVRNVSLKSKPTPLTSGPDEESVVYGNRAEEPTQKQSNFSPMVMIVSSVTLHQALAYQLQRSGVF